MLILLKNVWSRNKFNIVSKNWITLKRLIYGLKYNGFYNLEFNTVVLFATTFYPLLQGNSSTSTVVRSHNQQSWKSIELNVLSLRRRLRSHMKYCIRLHRDISQISLRQQRKSMTAWLPITSRAVRYGQRHDLPLFDYRINYFINL